jgi:diguanylate cyclase (GGDEF)-like protein/PAS domain S-box-containing protein
MTGKPTYEELEQRIRELEDAESERKRAEDALLESEGKCRTLVETAAESIFIAQDGIIKFCNKSFSSQIGYGLEELTTKTFADLIHPDDLKTVLHNYLQRIEGKDVPSRYSFRFIDAEGNTRWVVINAALISWEGRPASLCLATDITEQKQAMEALKARDEKFRQLYEKAQEGILIARGDTLEFVNPALERILGRPADVLTSEPFTSFIYPDDQEVLFDRHIRRMRGEVLERSHDFRVVTPDGTVKWVVIHAQVIDWDGSKANLSFVTDITERKQAEEELLRQKVRFESLFTNTNDAMVFVDEEHKIIDINYQFTRLFGYELDEIKGMSINKVVDPHGMADNIYASPRFLRGEKVEMEAVRYGKDGQPIDVLLKGAPVFIKGKIVGGYAIYSDMREKKLAEKLIVESRKRFEAIVSSLREAVFLIDQATRLIGECNNAATRIFGYSREELVGRQSSILHVDQAHFEQFGRDAMASYENPGYHATEFLMRRRDGTVFPTENYVRPVRDSDGRILYVVSVVRDISARKQAEEKIHQMAYYDSLTGLPNRELFSDRLRIALAHARRKQQRVAVAMLDLDNFKDVNDTLGHDVGDLLLKAVAERLSAALRASDTVARFGGDEFVLVIPDLKETADVIPVARKIVESFREPFLVDARELLVTISIGIAVYPGAGTQKNILLKKADSAMYRAKRAGRNRYQIYSKESRCSQG